MVSVTNLDLVGCPRSHLLARLQNGTPWRMTSPSAKKVIHNFNVRYLTGKQRVKTGLGRPCVSGIERDVKNPPLANIEEVNKALKLDA